MAVVLTLDQRGSRHAPDRVDEWVDALNRDHGEHMRLPFVRSAGDELQGVIGDSKVLADIVVEAVEDGGWWVGVGVGPIDSLGRTARDSQGPAFWHARQAVEAAKKTSRPQPVAVAGEPEGHAEVLGDALAALAFVALRRSPEQRESVRLLRTGLKSKDIASRLGVSPPAISQRLRGAGADEEQGLRRIVRNIASGLVEA
jgi:hypothetical protein